MNNYIKNPYNFVFINERHPQYNDGPVLLLWPAFITTLRPLSSHILHDFMYW